jgi:hypothetical protein
VTSGGLNQEQCKLQSRKMRWQAFMDGDTPSGMIETRDFNYSDECQRQIENILVWHVWGKCKIRRHIQYCLRDQISDLNIKSARILQGSIEFPKS